jgi:16S rRNA (guanine527-N7)-methyltransferase
LREVIAQLHLTNAHVISSDITEINQRFDLITARALAPLTDLFTLSYPLLGVTAKCLFPKGASYARELEDAAERWIFRHQLIHSKTQENSFIISVSELIARR